MTKYIIDGPAQLRGEVKLSGSKNSSLKLILLPLLSSGIYKLQNIPRNTSIENMLSILRDLQVKSEWDKGVLKINSQCLKNTTLSKDKFFHTSGAIYLIPILCGLFKKCRVEMGNQKDTGGDQIGRKFENVNSLLEKVGITSFRSQNYVEYTLTDVSKTKVVVEDKRFGDTVLAMFSFLMRDSKCEIHKPSEMAELEDMFRMLKEMGANIDVKSERIRIQKSKLIPVNYTCMNDKHELITFLAAALCTESEISISGLQYKKMKLDCLENFLDQLEVKVSFKDRKCHVLTNKISDLKPVDIYASEYPNFVTEWQVLFSPLIALVKGKSRVIEGYFKNRMLHWMDLKKFGAKYKYIKIKDLPEEVNCPRAVSVQGVLKLAGAHVQAKDVRAGAAMIIAGLCAVGRTIIDDENDNIKRGYENLDKKLISLGAKIKTYSL